MDCIRLADEIVAGLQPLVVDLPGDFYGSFRFTETGNNLTHPVTVGFLSRILWGISGITRVCIDLRLNLGNKVKFQPDVAGLDVDHRPVAFVDYESPNSSDARIPEKNVDAHARWQRQTGAGAPYVVITTLPEHPTGRWELRWTGPEQYNREFREQSRAILENPCGFWYKFYLDELSKRDVSNVAFVNIDGGTVKRVYPC